MDRVETEEDGIELYRKLEKLWSLAGMQARKWVSNSPVVIAATPKEDHATKVSLSDNQDPVIKALRLSWESKKDVLFIFTADVPLDLPLTKRSVWKKIAAVFDPLFFVSPFLVTAKILLQAFWARGYDCEDKILNEILDRILDWKLRHLGSFESVRIPRCLRRATKVLTSKMVVSPTWKIGQL